MNLYTDKEDTHCLEEGAASLGVWMKQMKVLDLTKIMFQCIFVVIHFLKCKNFGFGLKQI